MFKLKSPFLPAGDQPNAIQSLSAGIARGLDHQTLIGVTGSGKTFTMANVIEQARHPTLIISHNKTLAAQLYQEFKEFFPRNAVHYFVSYYDYYQPEAYIPQSDTYIEKDAAVNEELDRLRHAATQDLLDRDDVIVVASVSCIYNIGSPEEYREISLGLKAGERLTRKTFLANLVSLQYTRNELEHAPGSFRAKGDRVEVYPATGDKFFRVDFTKEKIVSIAEARDFLDPVFQTKAAIRIYPAKYWVTPQEKVKLAAAKIRAELENRVAEFKKAGKFLEAERITQRTENDLEMLLETGYCHGVENYSMYFEGREAGQAPFTLVDYFRYAKGNDFLTFIDESHMTVPQIGGMSAGDKARKQTLIEYGFRLPSAIENRPLTFEEFSERAPQRIYVSATPGPYEKKISKATVELLVRPTGLLEPSVEVRPTKNQISDLVQEIEKRVAAGQRVLVTVLTKRLAEDLTEYLANEGVKVHYLHSEIHTLDRPDILRDLREGKYDVLVGINLLREGLDLPEVSLVVILDADKEGFLRNDTTLIQTMGRAARHPNGHVIMYADMMTGSMQRAIREVERRRNIQKTYNEEHGITPTAVVKPIREPVVRRKEKVEETDDIDMSLPPALAFKTRGGKKYVRELEKKMKQAAEDWNFELAAKIRDYLRELRKIA